MEKRDYYTIILFITNIYILLRFASHTSYALIDATLNMKTFLVIPPMILLISGVMFAIASCHKIITIMSSDTAASVDDVAAIGRATIVMISLFVGYIISNHVFTSMLFAA